MAHWAELDNNNVVIRVLVTDNDDPAGDQGYSLLLSSLGGVWVQTSYNTFANKHSLGGTPTRKNYASPGFVYDQERDAFIPPKPFDSWILNEETCQWEPPIPYPEDGDIYNWNEDAQSWDLMVVEF